jgi:ligand-binding SRPBCC domain-containing protein
MQATFEKRSFVNAPVDDVWRFVTSPAGINHELMPVMRMTVPRHLKGKTIRDVSVGEKIGRSWFLLFGLVPFDFDDITIAELHHGHRFLERSTMFSMAFWEHERTVDEADGGCEVRDRVTFRLRPPMRFIPGAHRVLAWILHKLFVHRHRRLVRRFKASDQSQGENTSAKRR